MKLIMAEVNGINVLMTVILVTPYKCWNGYIPLNNPRITPVAKISIPMMSTIRIPIAIGMDFSKNFGYSLFGGGGADLSTIS